MLERCGHLEDVARYQSTLGDIRRSFELSIFRADPSVLGSFDLIVNTAKHRQVAVVVVVSAFMFYAVGGWRTGVREAEA